VVEQEVRLVAAEPGVPAEEAVPALGQVAGEVVLGEVDVVVGRDERRRRRFAGRAVVDALARVAASACPADGRRRQAHELPGDVRQEIPRLRSECLFWTLTVQITGAKLNLTLVSVVTG